MRGTVKRFSEPEMVPAVPIWKKGFKYKSCKLTFVIAKNVLGCRIGGCDRSGSGEKRRTDD